ncbi:MAG: hypothetical protein D6725_03060 [Planctomycetota bacterium]|nr:MAG: hypothetical protein D6725_03060 [Planctomycetota bacterium]
MNGAGRDDGTQRSRRTNRRPVAVPEGTTVVSNRPQNACRSSKSIQAAQPDVYETLRVFRE